MKETQMLLEAIKRGLLARAEADPNWRLFFGKEVLTAEQTIAKIDNDKKFRAYTISNYVALATELAGREHG